MSDHTPITNKLHLFPAKEVAMELCKQDSELLRRIRPEELQDAAWTKKASKVRGSGKGCGYRVIIEGHCEARGVARTTGRVSSSSN